MTQTYRAYFDNGCILEFDYENEYGAADYAQEKADLMEATVTALVVWNGDSV